MKWLSWAGQVGSIELLGGQDLHSGPNADSTFFNDPELALDRFILEPCEDAREYIKEVRLVLASEAKRGFGEAFNIADGQGVSVNSLAERIITFFKKDMKPRYEPASSPY